MVSGYNLVKYHSGNSATDTIPTSKGYETSIKKALQIILYNLLNTYTGIQKMCTIAFYAHYLYKNTHITPIIYYFNYVTLRFACFRMCDLCLNNISI
jgi:hypothetical protein